MDGGEDALRGGEGQAGGLLACDASSPMRLLLPLHRDCLMRGGSDAMRNVDLVFSLVDPVGGPSKDD